MNGKITLIRGDGAFRGGTVLDGTPWGKLLQAALDSPENELEESGGLDKVLETVYNIGKEERE